MSKTTAIRTMAKTFRTDWIFMERSLSKPDIIIAFYQSSCQGLKSGPRKLGFCIFRIVIERLSPQPLYRRANPAKRRQYLARTTTASKIFPDSKRPRQ